MKRILMMILILVLSGCTLQYDNKNNENEIIRKEEDNLMNKVKINTTVDTVNDNNESELLVAVHENNVDKAIELINAGANVNLQDNISDSPYLYAGAHGRTEILDHMLKVAEIDFSVVNRYGGNTLIPAAEKGHIDNVKLLVKDSRIDIDFQNNFGYTALIEAVALTDGSKDFIEIVRILVESGANIEIKDNYGNTALDYAKDKNYLEMIEILTK